jgi:hypothetical protein
MDVQIGDELTDDVAEWNGITARSEKFAVAIVRSGLFPVSALVGSEAARSTTARRYLSQMPVPILP